MTDFLQVDRIGIHLTIILNSTSIQSNHAADSRSTVPCYAWISTADGCLPTHSVAGQDRRRGSSSHSPPPLRQQHRPTIAWPTLMSNWPLSNCNAELSGYQSLLLLFRQCKLKVPEKQLCFCTSRTILKRLEKTFLKCTIRTFAEIFALLHIA
jgi:hypothetical protein